MPSDVADQRPIRLITAGTVSHLRSQTIYHGLAYARTEATPDTVVLLTPGEPYVCIGFHQDLEREVDLNFCREQRIPVLRRETGGGAVYLDSDQLFVQWVMDRDSLPANIERRFELFTQPLIVTYRAFGIDAEFRPANDVQVGGRKIVGTGAAHIGNAEVMVGNFIFDFDTATMAQVPRAPSAEFRAQLQSSLERYMTSTREVTGTEIDRTAVADHYIDSLASALGRPVHLGELTTAEEASIRALDAKFRSSEFLHGPGGMQRPGVKIHEDIYVAEVTHPGTPIRLTARLRHRQLEEITITGLPTTLADDLAATLRGTALEQHAIEKSLQPWLERHADTLPFSHDEFAQTVLALGQPQPLTPHDS